MTILTEGLRAGDLEDIVLPMATIDEYESKIDKTAVVVGFYVGDKDAADDLNRFIQKSAIDMLDTEVSPAPDQHGYYLVFVEIVNDDRVGENINNLLAEVSPLVGITEWQMRLRGLSGVRDFNRAVIEKRLSQLRKLADDTDKSEKIVEFLKPSALSEVCLKEGDVRLITQSGGTILAEGFDFGRIIDLYVAHNLHEAAIALDMRSVAETKRVGMMLGEQWSVTKIEKNLLLHRVDTETGLLLRGVSMR